MPVPQPVYDQYTQKCLEQAPALSIKGTWEQVWEVQDLTGEELEVAQERKVQDEQTKAIAYQKSLESALENHIDAKAQEYTWKNITSALAAASRPGVFQANAIMLANWWEACWIKAHEIQAAVVAGTKIIPTVEEFLAEMPVFTEEV